MKSKIIKGKENEIERKVPGKKNMMVDRVSVVRLLDLNSKKLFVWGNSILIVDSNEVMINVNVSSIRKTAGITEFSGVLPLDFSLRWIALHCILCRIFDRRSIW